MCVCVCMYVYVYVYVNGKLSRGPGKTLGAQRKKVFYSLLNTLFIYYLVIIST